MFILQFVCESDLCAFHVYKKQKRNSHKQLIFQSELMGIFQILRFQGYCWNSGIAMEGHLKLHLQSL